MAAVVVVGAGVVGLSCAVRLLEAGHEVRVLARELPTETTSAVAAALWYPYRAHPEALVTGWSRTGYGAFATLADDPATGVRMLAGTEVLRIPSPDPWWRSAVPSLARTGSPPAPYEDGWSFVAPVIEMPVYLPWLAARVGELGGSLTRRELTALPDGPETVVNATGLGARRTVSDSSVFPVRGQVVYVEQVGLDRWWLDGAAPVYVIPRSRDIVVGGTDDEGEWDLAVDTAVAGTILERACALVPELRGARVVGHRTGLRPARPAVRLEVERRADRSPVVHCYGHGGAGVTLSWGCADEVAALVAGL
ncbi:FAD-dependent oxidoreductase [Nakamurella deserti]|uniref:FAD-dependent oxidoreductase n=1 Tax=Nakamurella deserti TaxID=2164074 RepID=UPI000DBE5EB3|nr:FAD-dependent oxidoreductase [Nakamurella deserti]